MKRIAFMLAAMLLSAGCSTLSTRAEHIQVHRQYSAVLATCKKLGRVDANASGWTHLNPEQQSINDLRDATAKQYPDADSVVVVNIDSKVLETGAHASGVAYRCY